MTATTVDYAATLAALQAELDKARKAKKGTKVIRENIAQVEAAIAAAQTDETPADAPRRGRPRKYAPEFYTLRERLARAGRGRPSRTQIMSDLRELGVGEATIRNFVGTFRDLERFRARMVAEALDIAKGV